MRRFVPHCLLGLVLTLAVAGYVAALAGLVDGNVVLAQSHALQDAALGQPALAMAAFVAVYIVLMSLCLPLGGALGVIAGLLFGLWLGLGLVVLSGTISALALFILARGTFGERLRQRAGPLYRRVAAAMQANSFSYLLFMRIVPLFPFFVVTLVAALLGVRMRVFVLATILGKIPANMIYAGLGRDIGTAARLGDLITLSTFMRLAALGTLALVPVAYRLVRDRRAARAVASAERDDLLGRRQA
jgi:uncharacterized membrane protein YdjX (TVP38/TMEM64 family)